MAALGAAPHAQAPPVAPLIFSSLADLQQAITDARSRAAVAGRHNVVAPLYAAFFAAAPGASTSMSTLAPPSPALHSFLPPALDFTSHALALGATVAAARATGSSALTPRGLPLPSGFYVPLQVVARGSATPHLPLPIIGHQLSLGADAHADTAAPMLPSPALYLCPPAVAVASVNVSVRPAGATAAAGGAVPHTLSGRKRPRCSDEPPGSPAPPVGKPRRQARGRSFSNDYGTDGGPCVSLGPLRADTLHTSCAHPTHLPPAMFEGVGASTVPVYTETIARFLEFLASTGRVFPTPVSASLLGDFLKYMVKVRNRSSGSVPTWTAALSRLADYYPGCAAERSEQEKRHLARVIRGITLEYPVTPVGRAELRFPPLVAAVTSLSSSTSAADLQFLARLLTILNTGARAGETNCCMLTLDNVFVITTLGGAVDHIRLDMVFSKTRKHSAAPVYKYLFPRTDALDAVAPFLRFLRARHGYSPPRHGGGCDTRPCCYGRPTAFPTTVGEASRRYASRHGPPACSSGRGWLNGA